MKQVAEITHKVCSETSSNDLSNAIKALLILHDDLYGEMLLLEKAERIAGAGYLKACSDAMYAVFQELMRINGELEAASGRREAHR